MKNAAIIFHSLNGNTMGMAKYYEEAFLGEGYAVGLFKVFDPTYEEEFPKYYAAKNAEEQMRSIPVIRDVELLSDYTAIAMGCPVYFGNVSAQMKAFMDSFYRVGQRGIDLTGKYFLSFVSCTNFAGDGVSAIKALNDFAMHQGMIVVSVPPSTQFAPPYGSIHYSGPDASSPPDYSNFLGIRSHVNVAATAMSSDYELMQLIRDMGDNNI